MLVAAVLPGYVVQLIAERLYLTRRAAMDAFERLLHGLYYSAFIWAIVAVIAWLVGREDELMNALEGKADPHVYALALLVVVPVALLVAGAGALWHGSKLRTGVLKRAGVDPGHAVPTAWEWAFQRPGQLVRIVLEDGSVAGGPWVDDCFTSYSADGRDVFLAQPWAMDPSGWFSGPVPNAVGTWIRGDQIARVEFHNWPSS